MGYISAQQAATKWGISKRRVQVLCTENRIKNATRIGNMWVVPEDALKPADGRVQTHHTVESPTARAARTALKKLTVNAYQEINGKLNNPSTSKMVFVSLLATTIFCDIQNDESSNEKDDVFLMISSELLEIEFKESSRRSFWEMFSSLVSDFEKYIYRYADYVDDILSWAYQYVNKLSLDSGLESTQFFTEEYMIEYLTKGIPRTTTASSVYLDPACGGGNFLSHILNQLFVLRYRELDNPIACIENIFNALYGYELDPNLAAVASVNLKLKALMLLAKVQQVSTVDWRLFCPNIFTSVEPNGFGFLEADFSTHRIRRVADGKRENLESMTAVATEIYTNPPFQTVKGMASSMKEHLKKHFPNAKCDLCNAFILQCIDKIQTGGTIGLVTQSSWMYLDSFENLRRELITNNTIESIADLGSGAFYDLSGEKANVALVRVTKTPYANACVKVLTLRDIPLKEKAAVLGKASDSVLLMQQTQLFGGEHMAFSLSQTTPNTVHAMPGKYGDYGIPMQGTSTGDAARLIGYYWEHLNDPEWIPVSKGGSYSRWCGLNSYANERDHVQKIVEQHYWLFGEQYHLVTADKRMQKALEEYLYLLYGDKAPNPVLTPDEEELRRMDIFACAARNTEDANGSAIQENLVVELKAPKVVLTKAVLRQIEDYMDYVRKQPLFNSQYRRWKFIAVCSAVDDDVKARYDSQKSKGKKGLVAEIDNYEVYALTWDDVFQSFDLRHAFLLDKLKMDKEAIAAEIAQTAGDEKSKDTADALTALVAN